MFYLYKSRDPTGNICLIVGEAISAVLTGRSGGLFTLERTDWLKASIRKTLDGMAIRVTLFLFASTSLPSVAANITESPCRFAEQRGLSGFSV